MIRLEHTGVALVCVGCGHSWIAKLRSREPRWRPVTDTRGGRTPERPVDEAQRSASTQIMTGNLDRYSARFARPMNIDIHGKTSITVQWASEVWPKVSGPWSDIDPVRAPRRQITIRLVPASATKDLSQAKEATDDSDQRKVDGGNSDRNR